MSGLGMSIARDNFNKGHAEGELKRARENAINMLKDGMIVNLAAKYSGLPLEEVQALAATL